MRCKSFWKRWFPFTLTILISLLTINLLKCFSFQNQKDIAPSFVKILSNQENRTRISSACLKDNNLNELASSKQLAISNLDDRFLKIFYKPRAQYTEIARQNEVTGVMRVRVTFLSSGKIGNVIPINNLPDGLTEQAICAARKIKFQPTVKNGKSVNVSKIIEYSFAIY